MNPEFLISSDLRAPHLFLRTQRALLKQGVSETAIHEISLHGPHGKDNLLGENHTDAAPLCIIRAGAWPVFTDWKWPPASSTGRPIVAVGMIRKPAVGTSIVSEEFSGWQKVFQETGGDLQNYFRCGDRELLPASCWLDETAAIAFRSHVLSGVSIANAVRLVLQEPSNRFVYWSGLDVCHDSRLRIVQIITSLQRGGAERIALDLHRCWQRCSEMNALLIALGRPTREAFATPSDCIELASTGSRAARIQKAIEVAERSGGDLLHAHLLSRNDLKGLSMTGIPLLSTVHNARPGWTHETELLEPGDVNLLVACSMAVEKDLRDARIPIVTRTIWNGISISSCPVDETERRKAAAELTRRLQIPADAVLIVALANVRSQKRIERLPQILARTQSILQADGFPQQLHLLIAGEPSSGNEHAMRSEELLQDAIATCEVSAQVHRLGSVANVRELLSAADLLLSASDYEGLSLAHLEALASGVPVIATSVGGTSEIGTESDGLFLMHPNASDVDFAERAAAILQSPPVVTGSVVSRVFSLNTMADRYRRFYFQLANGNSRVKNNGLLLIINNFSTGGAQTSARRLLTELHSRGIHIRAAVLQEQPDHPTPGRQELLAAGIPVTALIPAGSIDPLQAIEPLLVDVNARPPEAVLLWNVIPEYKLLLADLLFDFQLFDVSPGEMNIQSLSNYFSKPRPGLPYRSFCDYGRRLQGSIVKYAKESSLAQAQLQTSVSVIPNGVPIPEQSVVHGLKEVIILGTAARINPQKRLEELIEAVRLADPDLPRYELRIAGGIERGCDDYAMRLRQQAAGLPVVWLGEIQDISEFLLSLDIFAMISNPAGCPNASLEAMAVGLPVIATDIGGASEQVIDGLNGRLVPASDPVALAAAMIELAQDSNVRANFGEASRKRIVEVFSIDQMTDSYQRVLFPESRSGDVLQS